MNDGIKLIGIDPGSLGAIAEIDLEHKIVRWMNIPYREDKIISLYAIKACFNFGEAYYTYMEKVHGMKPWGVSNNFNFGMYYGQMLAFLEKYPYELVSPQTWQRRINGMKKGVEPKAATASSFRKMNPNFGPIKKAHEGMIDAFFIAYFGGLINNIVMPKDFDFIHVDHEASCP